ncbi:MAG: 3-phosphoshikimate 1-carboxyvinyltransferase [Candidatus Binatia bacterium]
MTHPLRVSGRGARLGGVLAVPGDKSIAHRALLLGALAEGTSVVRGFPGGADVRATLGAIRALGAAVRHDGDVVEIEGRGLALGAGVDVTIDCANSGTTMRLGAGLMAAGQGRCTLEGDGSLRRRPMERVAEPLRQMGAHVHSTDGHAPLVIEGRPLHGITWTPPVASAQVKSAILLAGLRARGRTTVIEPLATRDHTERMLAHMDVGVVREGTRVSVTGMETLRPLTLTVPGDPSSAAFLLVAALLVPGSELRVTNVGTNPLRIGALEILRRMGADIALERARDEGGEPCGDLVVRYGELRGTTIGPAEIPGAIDELPILAVAAAFADGVTRVAGAAELRVKESDRIGALEQLRDLGVPLETTADGFEVRGRPHAALGGGRITTHGDHRIAMAFAVAALRSPDGLVIDDPDCAAVSFPGFFDRLAALGATVEAA